MIEKMLEKIISLEEAVLAFEERILKVLTDKERS
jgi:hypothetical protein